MQVSFLIPLYNCLSLSQAMLASLRSSVPRGLDHEVILVDDGSTDGTRDWLATLPPPCRVLLQETNRGYAVANNRGAAEARGELLLLLNNDVLLAPGWLEPLLALHRRLGARAGLIGNVQRDLRTGKIDHAGVFINRKAKPEHDREPPVGWRRLVHGWHEADAVTGACVLVSRSTWQQLGGFDEGFQNGGEDVDLCLRARAAGLVQAVADRSLIGHHVSASPGRARRNEQNSRRLALRWKDELIELAVLDWCRRYFTSDRLDPSQLTMLTELQLAQYALGWRRNPPRSAMDAMRRIIASAMQVELDRWEQMFGPADPIPA